MLLRQEKEELRFFGSSRISIEGIHKEAAKQEKGWRNFIVPGNNLLIGTDVMLSYEVGRTPIDITENAFTQFCNIKGIPTTYARKCLEADPLLMTYNFDAWATPGRYMLRNYEDELGNRSCRAIVSERFTPISNNTVLDLMEQNVDLNKYVCNQAYLSPEKMHIRMIDFDNPIQTADRSPLYTGFCVNNNEVGAGSLSIRFFIYRFACKNGIVRTAASGTMFQKRHVGLTVEEMTKFGACFENIQFLRDQAVNDILTAQKKVLSKQEMRKILDQVKKELHLTREMYIKEGDSQIEAEEWIGQNYGSNLWGVVNFVTEKAKDYSLDTRLELEMFADRLLSAA